jgi:hypothetical protein
MAVWAVAVAGISLVGIPAPVVVVVAVTGTIGILGFRG